MRMRRVAALAAAVTIMAGAAGCDRANGLTKGGEGGSTTGGGSRARSGSGGKADEGETLYMAACVMCHGENGRGTQLGPSLVDAEWLQGDSLSLAQITQVVRDGVPTPQQHPVPMPPRGNGRFTDAEIQAVSRYTYSLPR